MKVTSIRYFETRRGLGYEACTEDGAIWNDGNGGPTYWVGNNPELTKKHRDLSEDQLEELIDIYEEKYINQ